MPIAPALVELRQAQMRLPAQEEDEPDHVTTPSTKPLRSCSRPHARPRAAIRMLCALAAGRRVWQLRTSRLACELTDASGFPCRSVRSSTPCRIEPDRDGPEAHHDPA